MVVKNAIKAKWSFIKSFVWEELCILTGHLATRIAFQKQQSLCPLIGFGAPWSPQMTSGKRWGPIAIWRSRTFSANTKVSLPSPLPWSFTGFTTLDVRGKAICSKEPKAAFPVTVLLSANGNPSLQTRSLPRWCPGPVRSFTAGAEAGGGPRHGAQHEGPPRCLWRSYFGAATRSQDTVDSSGAVDGWWATSIRWYQPIHS